MIYSNVSNTNENICIETATEIGMEIGISYSPDKVGSKLAIFLYGWHTIQVLDISSVAL